MSARPSPRVSARELTPRGAGAVSVVELVGPGAHAHVVRAGGPATLAVGEARVAKLRFAGGLADEALVVRVAEDRIELHLHGSPALARAARAELTDDARAPAALEDRARERLERAPCEAAARILLDQSEGCLRRDLERLAHLGPEPARAFADLLARRGRVARFALEPAFVVLAGPVNAGKSTLFNVLAGETRALVAELPGTTRDVVSADVLLGSWPIRLHDTAGERALAGSDPAQAVEAEGQRRARLARASADLVLWLVPVDGARPPAPPDAEVVPTRADRSPDTARGAISALRDPEGARRRISEIVRARFDLPADAWTPGEAVPFEPSQVAALAAAARGVGDPRELARAWLASS